MPGREDYIPPHRWGAAKARDVATVTGRKTAQAKRAGVSEFTDRAQPDGLDGLRRRMDRLDHPVPRVHPDKLRPLPGRIFARALPAHAAAKAAGLVIPQILDRDRGQSGFSGYEVIAATPCGGVQDEVLGVMQDGHEIKHECTGACALPPGAVLIARRYAGESAETWLGERAVSMRCQLVWAVLDESASIG